MICKKLEEQMNGQLNYEFYSAYLYQSMSADFKAKGFNGFANRMQIQAQEELVHAMGFHNYILSRGGKVELMKIDAPPDDVEVRARRILPHPRTRGERYSPHQQTCENRKGRGGLRRIQLHAVVCQRAGRGGGECERDNQPAQDGRRLQAGALHD